MLKLFTQFFKNLLFPIFCISCNKEGCFLCEKCSQKIEKLPLSIVRSEDFAPIKTVFSPFKYKEGADAAKLLHVFKYQFAHEAHQAIINLMAPLLLKHKEIFQDSVLVPVPLHKKRFYWRGFNQSEILADDIGKFLKLPVLLMLKRVKNTKPQVQFEAKERLKNVEGAFELAKPPKNPPQKVFLVDDVITTGSTLKECAKAVLEYIDCEVDAVTFARPE